MRIVRSEPEEPVNYNKNKSSTKGWPKSGRAVNGAGQHRGDDHDQNGIKRRLFRKGAFTAHAHHYESRAEYDYPPQ
jgi:hypothetical protein